MHGRDAVVSERNRVLIPLHSTPFVRNMNMTRDGFFLSEKGYFVPLSSASAKSLKTNYYVMYVNQKLLSQF